MPIRERIIYRWRNFISEVIDNDIEIKELFDEDINNGWEYNSDTKIIKIQVIVNGQGNDWLYRIGDNGYGMSFNDIIDKYIPIGRSGDRDFGSRNLWGRGGKDSAAYGEKKIQSLKDGQFSQANMQPHENLDENVGTSEEYENDNHLSDQEKSLFNEMTSVEGSSDPSGTLVETKVKNRFSPPPSSEEVINHLKNSFKSSHVIRDESTKLILQFIDTSTQEDIKETILPDDDLWIDIETKSKSIQHNRSSRKIEFKISKIDEPREITEEIKELNKQKIIRPWGFFVGYEADGHEIFLDNTLGTSEGQIDGLEIMKNFRVQVICPYLKKLQTVERVGTTANIMKSDRSGLNLGHSFIKKVMKEIRTIRSEIIQQERSGQSGINQTAPVLSRLFESASALINKNLSSDLFDLNELNLSEPVEFRPPSPFSIKVDQEKTITLYAKNDLQPQIISNSNEEVVKVITRPNSWNAVEDIPGYEKTTFTLKGLSLGNSNIEFVSGDIRKIYKITVAPSVTIEFEPEFEFSPASKDLTIGKNTKIRLWCSPEIADSLENFQDGPEISTNHEEIEIISENRNWSIDDRFGFYFLDITVKATAKIYPERTPKFVSAKVSDKEAKCKISISQPDKIWKIDIIDKKRMLELGNEAQVYSKVRPVFADRESDPNYNLLKVYLTNKAFGKLPMYDSIGDWSRTKEDPEKFKKLNMLIAIESIDELSRDEIRIVVNNDGDYRDASGFEDIEPEMMKDRKKWYELRMKFLENENWGS